MHEDLGCVVEDTVTVLRSVHWLRQEEECVINEIDDIRGSRICEGGGAGELME